MREEFPLVSIITPSLNQGKFIEDTLESVRNQDYPNIEHIVVDGGSTDTTLDILKKHENTYSLKWISEPDRGQSDAVNKGFKMARGSVIGWLNSDDAYISKDVISFIVTEFANTPDMDVLYGDVALIDENSLILQVRLAPEFDYHRLLRDDFIPEPSTFYRRSVVNEHELDINIDLPMDYEYWLRLAKNSIQFRHVNKILSAARIHQDMKTLSRAKEMNTETEQVKIKYGQKFGPRYYQRKKLDNILFTLLTVYGTTKMVKLFLHTRENHLAFPINFDSVLRAVFRQLFFYSRFSRALLPLFFR